MAKKLDRRQMVTYEELFASNVIHIDAATKLLIEKGFLAQGELLISKGANQNWS
jgi:hypothetical protein